MGNKFKLKYSRNEYPYSLVYDDRTLFWLKGPITISDINDSIHIRITPWNNVKLKYQREEVYLLLKYYDVLIELLNKGEYVQ